MTYGLNFFRNKHAIKKKYQTFNVWLLKHLFLIPTEMELPNRKATDEDDYALEETNDVRSSLQGPLREGGPRAEDAGFLGGGGPPPSSSQRVQSAMFLISALAVLC